jgi:hypothetical protein
MHECILKTEQSKVTKLCVLKDSTDWQPKGFYYIYQFFSLIFFPIALQPSGPWPLFSVS